MKKNAVPALDGITVLSVGHTLPGLYCLAVLRDLGANIIRVERPAASRGGDYKGMEAVFPVRSLTAGSDELQLDLKSAVGKAAFGRIASQVDIVLEGFRPGVMRGLGLDYEELAAANARLVYLALTGYGQSGPDSREAGHDINFLAETGVLALANPPGLPGVTFADGMAGMSAAMNILAALHRRDKTNTGAYLDGAIVDGPLSLMATEIEYEWQHRENRGVGAHHLVGSHPWYGVYKTKDDKYVALGAVEPRFYRNLVTGLGREDLLDKQFVDGDELEAIRGIIAGEIASRTRDELVVCCPDACLSPVLDTAEVLQSPVMDRVLNRDAEGNPVVRTPVRLPVGTIKKGSDTTGVLKQFGFTAAEIDELTG